MAEGLLLVYLLGVIVSISFMVLLNVMVFRQSWKHRLWVTLIVGGLSWVVPLCIVFTCFLKILDEKKVIRFHK